MSPLRSTVGRRLQLVLLSLLLSLQVQALAHEFDHQQDAEADACVLCCHGAGHDAAVTGAPPTLPVPDTGIPALTRGSPAPADADPYTPGARAPPIA